MTVSQSERDPFDELADSFLARYRAGERPSVGEYAAQYPELAEQIRQLFPALVMMEEHRPGREGPAEMDRAPARPPERLGEFRILREVGRGGMGVVYEAVQESLGRHVALKVLPFNALVNPAHLERFRREVRAAARLHHTHIVPVFGVGEEGGIHYYAMQFIQGQGLDEVLQEVRRLRGLGPERHTPDRDDHGRQSRTMADALLNGQFAPVVADQKEGMRAAGAFPRPDNESPAEPTASPRPEEPTPDRLPSCSDMTSQIAAQYYRSVAHLGVQVADALEYAHQHGVLHRDIKPSNLLLDTSGAVWVTDFGLAKADDSEALTQTGDIVGTRRYMAPERFQGRSDRRSDVYGLGMTLYELLALRLPFQDSDRARLLQRISDEEPPKPHRFDPHIPRDLETIVLKAIARRPEDRYATAAGLGEDLGRFLSDRPIRARRTAAAERAWRWCRRNPVLAATGGLAAAALVAVAGLSIALAIYDHHAATQAQAQALQLREEEAQTRVALDEAKRQRRRAEWSATNSALDQALNLCEHGDVALGTLWLTRSLKMAQELEMTEEHVPELRRVIRANLAGWKGGLQPLRALLPHRDSVIAVAFSPDGKKIVTGSWDMEARLWDAQTGEQLGPPLWHGHHVPAVAFSPNGQTVLTGGGDRQAQLWDVATGKPLGQRLRSKGYINAVAFSPDRRTVLTGESGGRVRRWDAATGEFLAEVASHGTQVYALAFSPDGQTLMTGADDKTARLWDAVTGQPKGEPLRLHQHMVKAVAISHDGAHLLTGSMDGTAQVWDAATLKPLGLPLQHRGQVYAAAFSRDDRMILTGSRDGTARVWDAATLKPLGLPLQHRGTVYTAAFSPDGKTVATGGIENAARLWDVTALGGTGMSLRKPNGWIRGVAISPSGRHLLTGGDDHTAQLWDLSTYQPVGKPLPHNSRVRAVAFHPDGTKFLTAGMEDGTAQLWEVNTGKPIGAPMRAPSCWAAAFSPNGRTILTGDHEGNVHRWDTATTTRVDVLVHHPDELRALAWSPDGRKILTGGIDGTARLWDATTGEALGQPLRHASAVWAVAFSPDGRTILTGSWDGTARLWQAATGQPKGGPFQHQAKIEAATFSPDGRTIVTGSLDGTARLWDVDTGKPIGPPLSHDDMVLAVAFHPDGQTVATAGADGRAHLWPVPTPIDGAVEDVALQTELLAGMHLEPSGAATLLDANTWSRLRWRRELPLYSLLIGLSPLHPEPYYQRGRVYERLGQMEKAVADWSAALRWQAGEPKLRAELLSRRGSAYLFLKKYRLAVLDLRQALELEPDRADACNDLAWLYLTAPAEIRDPEEALPLAQRAVALAPAQAVYVNTLGIAYYRLGWYQRAQSTLEHSNPGAEAFDLFFLAMCRARLGEPTEARACYDRAVEWLRERRGKLPVGWEADLDSFREEADAVLAEGPQP